MTKMRLRSFGTHPRLVTDSFSKSSECYVPGTVLGAEGTFVNEEEQLSAWGASGADGEWKAGRKQAVHLKKRK